MVPPAGFAAGAGPLIAAGSVPAALSARYRAPPARLASDLRSRRARAARTIPRSLGAVPDLLLSVIAVRRGSVPRGLSGPGARWPGATTAPVEIGAEATRLGTLSEQTARRSSAERLGIRWTRADRNPAPGAPPGARIGCGTYGLPWSASYSTTMSRPPGASDAPDRREERPAGRATKWRLLAARTPSNGPRGKPSREVRDGASRPRTPGNRVATRRSPCASARPSRSTVAMLARAEAVGQRERELAVAGPELEPAPPGDASGCRAAACRRRRGRRGLDRSTCAAATNGAPSQPHARSPAARGTAATAGASRGRAATTARRTVPMRSRPAPRATPRSSSRRRPCRRPTSSAAAGRGPRGSSPR